MPKVKANGITINYEQQGTGEPLVLIPFLAADNACYAFQVHDALAQLPRIEAPTQITFGRHDAVCSTRFAEPMKNGIKGSELFVFETCAHAPIYENVAGFNEKTLSFLKRHVG
jgi:pimeloyl-ACP methyl ester carboxylesterase